jgi:transposase
VGVDSGKPTHYAGVVDAGGSPCLPKALAWTHTHEGYAQLYVAMAAATAQAPASQVRVGGEATGPYWLSLYAALTARGSRVRVLNPLSGKARRGPTLRGTQTETGEARLSAASVRCEAGPPAPVPEASVPGLRAWTRGRADLVAQSGDGKRRVSGVLDRTCPEVASGFREVFGRTARAVLKEWPRPEQLAAGPSAQVAALRGQVARGRCGTPRARARQEGAQPSMGGRRGADALAFAGRLRWRPVSSLESPGAELEEASGRRERELATALAPSPGLGPAPAPAL